MSKLTRVWFDPGCIQGNTVCRVWTGKGSYKLVKISRFLVRAVSLQKNNEFLWSSLWMINIRVSLRFLLNSVHDNPASKLSSDQLSDFHEYFWFKYDIGQKYYAPHVWPEWGSNSSPPDHDSTYHVTETPAPTTWPSVTNHGTNICFSSVFQNLWIRQGAVGFICGVARHLNIADVHCNLLPLVKPFLTREVIQLDTEVIRMNISFHSRGIGTKKDNVGLHSNLQLNCSGLKLFSLI